MPIFRLAALIDALSWLSSRGRGSTSGRQLHVASAGSARLGDDPFLSTVSHRSASMETGKSPSSRAELLKKRASIQGSSEALRRGTTRCSPPPVLREKGLRRCRVGELYSVRRIVVASEGLRRQARGFRAFGRRIAPCQADLGYFEEISRNSLMVHEGSTRQHAMFLVFSAAPVPRPRGRRRQRLHHVVSTCGP